jgi:hypothetical protein
MKVDVPDGMYLSLIQSGGRHQGYPHLQHGRARLAQHARPSRSPDVRADQRIRQLRRAQQERPGRALGALLLGQAMGQRPGSVSVLSTSRRGRRRHRETIASPGSDSR